MTMYWANPVTVMQANRGDDLVGTPRQSSQQCLAGITVTGFAQYIVIDHHFSVGAQHRQIIPTTGNKVLLAHARLVTGHALDIGQGRFPYPPGFLHIRRHHLEVQSELAQ